LSYLNRLRFDHIQEWGQSVKLICTVEVRNRMGLHTRPAIAIVKLLQNCNSMVHFTHQEETVDAKSVLNLLMLAAAKNAQITISIDGSDADLTMEKLVQAFANKFGE